MSLINEALKKAQRERSGTPSAAMPNTGDFDQRTAPPKRTQSLILVVAGAAALVILSVGITVYLVNRTPAAAPLTPVVADAEAITPAPVAPLPAAEAPTVTPITLALPAIEKAPDEVVAVPIVTAAPVEAPPAPATRQPELHIQLFVDAIRVMGIRSSGGESKVLMNDRVYRVNDIVDRVLVLKLVKVEPEMLTFNDVNGMVYTKSF